MVLPVLLAQTTAPKRYAVLVGINRYEHDKLKPLQFAEADVKELKDVLTKADYEVTLLTGSAREDGLRPTKENIERHVHDVLRKCRRGDTALLAFAGHGLQFEAKDDKEKSDCYFCPLDARPFRDEADTLVSLGKVYTELEKSFAGMKVLLVDACRDDPDAGRGTRGINADSAPRPPQGVAALFSCRAGERAYEHEKLSHGVFFYHVLKGLNGEAKDRRGRITFAGLASYVSQEVAGGDEGVPKLVGGDAKQSPNLKADYSTEPVLLTMRDSGSRPGDGGEVKEDGKVAVLDLGGGVKMEFLRIPRGEFLMGSPKDEKDRFDDETQHEVEITRQFYLGKYEVTRGQFRRFVADAEYQTEAEKDGLGGWGYDEEAGTFKGPLFDLKTGERSGGETTDYSWRKTGFAQTDEHPVVNVTWNDAVAFCRWLARKSGKAVRLPSEAEWEYACRAGTTTRFYSGGDAETLAEVGNVADGTAKRKFPKWTAIEAEDGYVFTAPAGRFRPNKFGLFDMHGNVWEWCQDWYGEDYYANSPKRDPQGPNNGTARVLRGGSCFNLERPCRAAIRVRRAPASRGYDSGLRVAFRLD
jgi:formylglycine-generating enzyme required for sulfatase activity